MTEFRIQPRPLRPNHLFMDIHKDKKEKHEDEDAFTKYHGYKNKIALLFSDLPSKHKFWLHGGKSVKGLHELYEELADMNDEVFSHHVTRTKNDFADWVRFVYQDEDLAMNLARAKNRGEAKRAIENRIDSIVFEIGEPKTDKGFLKALTEKLTKQNERLEKELIDKKEWLNRKQKELEAWENKNLEHEKGLYSKYKLLERQEQQMYNKFKKLQEEETVLSKALAEEKVEIEKQRKELNSKQNEHEARKRTVFLKQHQHIYARLDELMSLTTACLHNKDYPSAKDAMSKVKYYYDVLPNADPRKKEFYMRIIKLRNEIPKTQNGM